HEQRLVTVEGLGRSGCPQPGQQPGLVVADVAGNKGLLDERRIAQLPAHPHLSMRRRHRQVTARGQPGSRVVRTVGGPVAPGIEGGHGANRDGLEPLELAVQRVDRVAVGQHDRVEPGQPVEDLRQLSCHVGAHRHGQPPALTHLPDPRGSGPCYLRGTYVRCQAFPRNLGNFLATSTWLAMSVESTCWSTAPTSGTSRHGSVMRARHAATKRSEWSTRNERLWKGRTVGSTGSVSPNPLKRRATD